FKATIIWRIFGVATALAVCVLCGPLQGTAMGQEAPPLPAGRGIAPAELQDLFDSYVMLQAERQLKLTNEQIGPFIVRLKALQTARRRADNQRVRIVQELRRLTQTDDKVDETQIRDRLKMLDDLDVNATA